MDTMKKQILKLAEFLTCVDDLQCVISLDCSNKEYIREKLACIKQTLAELEGLNEHD